LAVNFLATALDYLLCRFAWQILRKPFWAFEMRASSKLKKRKIAGDLPKENHGPTAPPKKLHDWMVMYNALVQFGLEKGHCNGTLTLLPAFHPYSSSAHSPFPALSPTVPLRHSPIKVNEEDSVNLGAWLATQRAVHLSGKMKPDRLALMQALVDENKLEWAPMNHGGRKQAEGTWPIMFECLRLYC